MCFRVVKVITAILVLTLLIGCKQETKKGEIPFNKINNLPIISLTINNKNVKLLIDTGANSSILHEPLKNKLNFKVSNSKVIFNGLGGQQNSKTVTNAVLRYKDSIINIKFKASNLSHVRRVLKIDGILGSEYLNQNNIIIDYKNNKIYKK